MPSINQPGRVASDKISKAEVLDAITSDSQKYDGGNIDASVSSRATPADTGSGIDWASKTPKADTTTNLTVSSSAQRDLISVTGSGFVTHATVYVEANNSGLKGILEIDGTEVGRRDLEQNISRAVGEDFFGGTSDATKVDFRGLYRFNTELKVTGFNNLSTSEPFAAEVDYVLD
jgi:hypothetical protein